jgi:hypothetical protein
MFTSCARLRLQTSGVSAFARQDAPTIIQIVVSLWANPDTISKFVDKAAVNPRILASATHTSGLLLSGGCL